MVTQQLTTTADDNELIFPEKLGLKERRKERGDGESDFEIKWGEGARVESASVWGLTLACMAG